MILTYKSAPTTFYH